MIYNEKVDIIIPAYNVPDDILMRVLSSIACQDKKEFFEITIVDDASTQQNYQEVIDRFKTILKINLLRYEINGGPGVARQYGLDRTNNEFITFVDADDVINGYFSLNMLRDALINNKQWQMVRGQTQETLEYPNQCVFSPMGLNMVWLFGKMYRRSFLERYGIHFHPTARSNEDVGFNAQWEMYLEDTDSIGNIEEVVYYWLDNHNSITREDNRSYSYRDDETGSFYGFVENMCFSVGECLKRKPASQYIQKYIIETMISIYVYYFECECLAPQYAKKNFEYCKKFYKKYYEGLEDSIPQNLLKNIYSIVLKDFYMSNKSFDIIPSLDYFTFLNKLKEV